MSQEGQRGLRGGQLAQHEGSEGFGLGPAPLLARHVAAGRAHGHGWDLVSFPLGRCRLTPEGPSRGSGASQHHAACSGEFPHADIHCLPPSSLFFFFQEKCLNICKNRTIVFALQQRERVTVAIIS